MIEVFVRYEASEPSMQLHLTEVGTLKSEHQYVKVGTVLQQNDALSTLGGRNEQIFQLIMAVSQSHIYRFEVQLSVTYLLGCVSTS